jgi:uncharacterized protein (DUF983 family)
LAWDSNLTFTETAVIASKNGANIEVGKGSLFETFIDVTAISGTGATLDIKFQESDDGTTFTDILSVPQFTAVGKKTEYIKSTKKYVRYVLTIAGTSPSVSLEIRMR